MKVLMVSDFYLPTTGGTERAIADLSQELRRRGHTVVIATLWQDGLPAYEEIDGLAVYRLRGLAHRLPLLYTQPRKRYHPPFPDPLVTRELAALIVYVRPDIVHGHSWALLSALPVCRARRIATVLTLHDYALLCPKKTMLHAEARPCTTGLGQDCLRCAPTMYGRPRGLAVTAGLALGRKGVGGIDRFIAISSYVAMTHTRTGLLDAARIDTVLCDTGARRLPGLPDAYILFVGALGRHKGLHHLLHAYASLARDIPLVLIGPACPDTPAILPAGVIAIGDRAHADVIAAIDGCCFLVSPALWPEPFGLVLIEAMARGKAVVASNAGGPIEIVRDGETGLLVPPGDVTALTGALRLLVDEPRLAARMGRAGAARCAVSFSAAAVLPRIEAVYEAVRRGRQVIQA
jgi:glycosyltransferase involved in cell wall biosynthesis